MTLNITEVQIMESYSLSRREFLKKAAAALAVLGFIRATKMFDVFFPKENSGKIKEARYYKTGDRLAG